MARVTNPLLSMDASGTVGKSITFAKWKGRHYARGYVVPSNPKSAKQMGIRAMMKFLSMQWTLIKSAVESGYEAAALAKGISTFNEYCSANMAYWRDAMFPSKAAAHAMAIAGTTVATLLTPAGNGSCAITGTATTATGMWGVAIFRSTSTLVDCNRDNCIAVVPFSSGVNFSYLDADLPAATYHYRAQVITEDGVGGTVKADQTAVIS